MKWLLGMMWQTLGGGGWATWCDSLWEMEAMRNGVAARHCVANTPHGMTAGRWLNKRLFATGWWWWWTNGVVWVECSGITPTETGWIITWQTDSGMNINGQHVPIMRSSSKDGSGNDCQAPIGNSPGPTRLDLNECTSKSLQRNTTGISRPRQTI